MRSTSSCASRAATNATSPVSPRIRETVSADARIYPEKGLVAVRRNGEVLPRAPRLAAKAKLGGEAVTTTVEGRERFGVIVRYPRELRSSPELIELDLATAGVNGAEMNTRMGSLRFARARLHAEARGTTLEIPVQSDASVRASAEAEMSTWRARREELQNTLAAIDGQIAQGRQRVAELRARMASLEASLRIAQQELAISESLVKDKLVSELEHFQRRSAVERIKGDLEGTRQAIPGAQGQTDEAVARRREEESKFRRRASDELSELERKIASLGEELNRAEDQEARAVIRAPIDGVVKNIKFQSAGNVVKAGEPIMEVVPVKEQLVVELRLQPSDRGYVAVGQSALVKVSAYDFYRFGGLEGRVDAIGADTDPTDPTDRNGAEPACRACPSVRSVPARGWRPACSTPAASSMRWRSLRSSSSSFERRTALSRALRSASK